MPRNPNHYTKASIAKRYGLSPQRVGQLANGVLAPALVQGGRVIDTEHPVFREWARKRTVRMEEDLSDQGARLAEGSINEVPADIEPYADMSVREVIERFGTDVRFFEFLKAVEKIEAIREKRIRNSEREGKLVARDLVMRALVGPIEAAHSGLLQDGVKTIAARVHVLVQSGSTVLEVEQFIREYMSSFIRPVKAKMSRAAIMRSVSEDD